MIGLLLFAVSVGRAEARETIAELLAAHPVPLAHELLAQYFAQDDGGQRPLEILRLHDLGDTLECLGRLPAALADAQGDCVG